MRNGRFFSVLFIAVIFLASMAAAETRGDSAAPSGNQLLQRADARENPFRDATLRCSMRLKAPVSTKELEFILLQKGEKRLIRFVSPDDVKGMAFLVQSPDTLYALLPAFGNRIRRIGTQIRDQGFMGGEMTLQDLALTEFSPFYDAKAVGQEGRSTILELVQKPGAQGLFPRLKVWIDRESSSIGRIEYFDAQGKKQRTQIRSDFAEDPATHYRLPRKALFIDHRRNDHETELTVIDSRFDTGLSDDAFTKRAMQSGAN